MNNEERHLARKYAIAFMHCFHDQLHEKDYNALERFDQFLAASPALSSYFKLSLLENVIDNVLKKITKEFTISHMQELLRVLKDAQRLFLLPAIIHYLVIFYRKYHAIMIMDVQSSHELSAQQRKQINAFFTEKTKHNLVCTYTINQHLIAGIRAQSDIVLWEFSIDKILREAEQSLNI